MIYVASIVTMLKRLTIVYYTLNAPSGIVTEIAQLSERYQEKRILRSENSFQAAGALLGTLLINTMLRQAQVMGVDQPVDLDEHVLAYIYGRIVPKD